MAPGIYTEDSTPKTNLREKVPVEEEAETALVLLPLDRAKLFLSLLDHQPVQLAGKGRLEAANWKMQVTTCTT